MCTTSAYGSSLKQVATGIWLELLAGYPAMDTAQGEYRVERAQGEYI